MRQGLLVEMPDDYAELICKLRNIKPKSDESWIQALLNNTYEQYIVLDSKLFIIHNDYVDDISLLKQYREGRFKYIFTDDDTSLYEHLETAYNQWLEENKIK